MIITSNLKYFNGKYEIKHTRYPNGRRSRVQLKINPNYHTHMRTFKEAIDIANFAKYKEIPNKADIDYLESLLRLTQNEEFRKEIEQIMNSKNFRYNEGCTYKVQLLHERNFK